MRLPLTLLALVSTFFSPAGRCDDHKQGQVEQLVRTEFQELSITRRQEVVVLEVCFDLCVFQCRGSPHADEAWDFVAAYLYKKGVGRESEAFISNAKASVQVAVKRMSAYCTADSVDAKAPFDCSWVPLAKSKSIRVGTSAYDEGERCFGWRDLSSDARPTRPHCRPVSAVPWKRQANDSPK